jgi:hypothetical protein
MVAAQALALLQQLLVLQPLLQFLRQLPNYPRVQLHLRLMLQQGCKLLRGPL